MSKGCGMSVVYPAQREVRSVTGNTQEEIQENMCKAILEIRDLYPHGLTAAHWDDQIVLPGAPVSLVAKVRMMVISRWPKGVKTREQTGNTSTAL